MYNFYTDTIKVTVTNNIVTFEHDDNIVYLCQLAEKQPFTYAKLAMQENMLQS